MQLLQKSGIQMNARETGIGGILSHPDKNYDFYIVKRKVSMFILMKLTYFPFFHTINRVSS